MNVAADQDMEANMDKRPATAKLRMLAEVMEILQKCVHIFIVRNVF